MDPFSLFAGIKALFSRFAANAFGRFVLQAGGSLIASQIAAALSSPPVRADQSGARGERLTSLDGNVLRPDAPFPRVLGSQRLFPPLMAEPLYTFENGQEMVEGVYGLAGPHDLEALEINGAPVAGLAGVEIALFDGTRRTRPQTLLRRYGFTEAPQSELAGHKVISDGVTLDLSQGDVAGAVPQPQIYTKVARADEFWLQLVWQSGLHREASAAAPIVVPLRLRIRPPGGEWRNLPEVHVQGRSYLIRRATIRLIWQAAAPSVAVSTEDGFVRAHRAVPAAADGSGGWLADAEFDAGSGDDWLDVNNPGSTRLRRLQADAHEVRVYLDPAEFAPGAWDVEVIRGMGFQASGFARAGYTYGGTVRDFFGWFGTPPRIAESRGPIQDAVTVARAISVVNQTPTPSTRVATIALRARGVAVQRLSVLAHGLVRARGDNALPDGEAPQDWTAASGAVLTPDAGTWQSGRWTEAVVVESAGDAAARAQTATAAPVAPGAWRVRALVTAGESARLTINDGTARSVTVDLTEQTIGALVNAGTGHTGQPYVRQIEVGIYEIGLTLWVTSAATITVGVGPGSATAGDAVTVLMADLARDWQTGQRSDNPADLYLDALITRDRAYPLALGEVDEGAILDWRDRAAREGWTCNCVIEDSTLGEVLRITAGAGYARPLMGSAVSVIQDHDRRLDQPVHIFTPRNSAGLMWQRASGDLPSGLRVKYRDRDGIAQEIVVLADGQRAAGRELEQVEYEPVQTESDAVARARYDLRSGRFRREAYSLDAPPAALALLPGSLVGVLSDEYSDLMVAGVLHRRPVTAIGTDDAGDVLFITRGGEDFVFTVEVPLPAADTEFDSIGAPGWADAATMADLGDMRRAGRVLTCSIQGEDGLWRGYPLAAHAGRTNLLEIDAPDSVLRAGAEIAIHLDPELFVVAEVAPRADLSAQIVLVPDASAQIWGAA